jgi:ADP-heptose:LPS heptosyltransferase
MNRGFTFQNIETAILNRIPSCLHGKVSLLPKNTRIDVYAALADRADVFLSGDTGPLHIAASRKIALTSPNQYKNDTALVGVFGATNSEMYGYDSQSPKHASAPQDAPSRVFEGHPPCKNLTCIDKIWKNCPHRRCFEGLRPETISAYVGDYFS